MDLTSMDLTNADVQDILQLIDSMPVRELHLQTTRFTLSLRRGQDGEWTQELQVLSEPNMLPDAGPAAQPGPAGPAGPPAAPAPAAPAGPAAPAPKVPDTRADVRIRDEDALAAAARGTSPGTPAVVRAPLLGTFYRAPRPGAPPFVDVGSQVDPDTVIGIIETMKLMNSVCAGVHGTVAEILVANAQFTPQGEPLMRIVTNQAGARQ